MATPRDVRRLALMALFQIDATGGENLDDIRDTLEDTESLAEEGLTFIDSPTSFRDTDRDAAVALAMAAYEGRADADAAMLVLAPDWPAGRQAAIDRAILRLAFHEITATDHPPKAVVNEAVELAKAFSTEKSPAFVNGLLGKFLKQHLSATEAVTEAAADTADEAPTEPAAETPTEPVE
ncbi:MAG: N utilization substance protein B [Phycisphaerales bacterium]|jgi:N utilization substance protein B